jgi:3-deoxy-manno-octulosonate cytidylyltransferase (CMP-KDO synthetase)
MDEIKILAVIPARFQSQRFPGKPLAKIGDRPMVQWVYEAAASCPSFYKVVVATDDRSIADCVTAFGGEVEMTSSDCHSGSDRVAEVAMRYPEAVAVANVQGDQPFVTAEMLSQLVSPYLQGEKPNMTTLACPLNQETGYNDPNSVKVICDRQDFALYFSRSPIPFYRNSGLAPVFHHLGLYAFDRNFLAKYAQLEPTPLEHCEGLEQLRVLEHGYKIRVCYTQTSVVEVNTPEDLLLAQSLVKSAKIHE